MKFAVIILLLSVVAASPAASANTAANALEVRAMTFNIRNGRAKDGENRWDLRKNLVCDVIRDQAPDVIGIQEAFRFQLDLLKTELPAYGEVGTGRDGGTKGEYSSIHYRKARFDVADSGTFWLSDTPATPSRSWGNRYLRICTWALLIDKKTTRSLYVYNTHMDHQSQKAREKGAELIMTRIAQRTRQAPFILMGDFNAAEDSGVVTYLTGAAKLVDANPIPVVDSFRQCHPDEKTVGTGSRFNGYVDGPKIDYIFVAPETTTLTAEIVRINRNGRYPSDHYPVTSVLQLKTTAQAP